MITGKRISFLIILLTIAALAAVVLPFTQVGAQSSKNDALSREAILRDPAAPTFGNLKGDVTIVEWFDYQCPYCKKMNPDLLKTVREDGHIRIVFKDWPVFGPASTYAAKLVLATKYQNKYEQAHNALMATIGRLNEDMVRDTLTKAGIDLARAERDLETHRKDIDALLARNDEQASGLGFQGTPAFIIGQYRVPGAIDTANLKLAIKDAREALKQHKK
jgi:protein-disulfide isomerase